MHAAGATGSRRAGRVPARGSQCQQTLLLLLLRLHLAMQVVGLLRRLVILALILAVEHVRGCAIAMALHGLVLAVCHRYERLVAACVDFRNVHKHGVDCRNVHEYHTVRKYGVDLSNVHKYGVDLRNAHKYGMHARRSGRALQALLT